MIRVIIADDENRICKLIIKLIDWNKLDMMVVGTASNGIEALELIKKENPDIVITDIRMPGYDGLHMIEKAQNINKDLEFIIISGYGQFGYAKKAIEYGVKDYLLKPINKEELKKTLSKVGDYIKKKRGQRDLNNEYKLKIKDDVNIVRESFLSNLLLFDSKNFNEYSLSKINERYYFKFQHGFFRIVVFRIDYVVNSCLNNMEKIIDRTIDGIKASLQSISYDFEIVKNKENVYILINYSQDFRRHIEDGFLKILESFKKTMHTFEKIEMTIGYGEEIDDLKDIIRSFESANLLIEDRILKGTGKIIKSDGVKTDKIAIDNIFFNFSKKFIKAIELLDTEEAKKTIFDFKKNISLKNMRGTEFKNLIHEVGNIYYTTMKKNNIKIDNGFENQKKLEEAIESCKSADSLFNELLNFIISSLTCIAYNKSHSNLRQIGRAKEYIHENYMKNITLEDLGAYIGYNPSYFSSLFKKETGTSFIEYLSKTRIEKAKDLLRESDLRVQDISLMVGYNDVKYFSKSFIKHTGLKPNEYRKIFI